MSRMNWDRVRRDRRAADHGTERYHHEPEVADPVAVTWIIRMAGVPPGREMLWSCYRKSKQLLSGEERRVVCNLLRRLPREIEADSFDPYLLSRRGRGASIRCWDLLARVVRLGLERPVPG